MNLNTQCKQFYRNEIRYKIENLLKSLKPIETLKPIEDTERKLLSCPIGSLFKPIQTFENIETCSNLLKTMKKVLRCHMGNLLKSFETY